MAKAEERVLGLLHKGKHLEATGDFQGAVNVYQKALVLAPDNTCLLVSLGGIACRVGRLDKAQTMIQKAIDREPDRWEYHKDLGNIFKRQGRLDAAEASLLNAISLSPDTAANHYDLGIVYQISGRFEKALKCYRDTVERDPDHAFAWNNMGLIHQEWHACNEAADCFLAAINKKTDFVGAYNNLGNLFRAENDYQSAVNYYQHSLAIDSTQANIHSLLGNTYQLMRRPLDATTCYQRAVELEPGLAEYWVNLGTGFHDQKNWQSAIKCYQKALAIKPELPQAHLNLGVVYKELGRALNALKCFEAALGFDSTNGTALNHLIVQLYYQCEWNRLDDYNPLLDEMTTKSLSQGKQPHEDPFLNLIRHDDPELNLEVAGAWSKSIEQRCNNARFITKTKRPIRKKRRIGYLSANFKNHPGADLILGILDHYDRDSFETICYSWGEDDQSFQRKRIIDACDRFVDIRELDDDQAAKQIYSDKIDILVDLLGYLKNYRLAISANRPAPLQVRLLGFVGTTGAEFFDYMISDAIVTPENHQRHFSEKLIIMPDSYLVNNYAKDNRHLKRYRDKKKTSDPFAFCCFNTSYKLDPVLFAVWMKILKKVPGSVLWLMPESALVQRNLIQFAADCGVEEDRLVFQGKLPKSEHLNRLTRCDLALDTRNINGVASTMDALWMGLPVITLQGKHFASRVSSSLLHSIGLPELVTTSLENYSALAINMANDPDRLRSIKETIENNRISGPLFDTQQFVKYLESAYHKIWDRYVNEKPAQSIVLSADC